MPCTARAVPGSITYGPCPWIECGSAVEYIQNWSVKIPIGSRRLHSWPLGPWGALGHVACMLATSWISTTSAVAWYCNWAWAPGVWEASLNTHIAWVANRVVNFRAHWVFVRPLEPIGACSGQYIPFCVAPIVATAPKKRISITSFLWGSFCIHNCNMPDYGHNY